jgi:hypothetical protein
MKVLRKLGKYRDFININARKLNPFRGEMNRIRNSLHHYKHRLLNTLVLSYFRDFPGVENIIPASGINNEEHKSNSPLDTEFNGMGVM